jgi:CubicO group peptidase (beta-lactamase class C family)
MVPGYSDTKSVMNALIGALVQRGRLAKDAPAPITEWAHDGRSAITIDALLRMRSGLAWDESLSGGADDAARMWFLERDMASLPVGRPLAWAPGSQWQYNSGNSVVLARIVRDAAGGTQEAALRFADEALFAPLSMHHVAFEVDSVGTPNGGSGMLASPRDWARFGALYLADGIAGGERILPAGWVDYSATPASDAWVGYGAAFWTNRGDSKGATRRREWGMPAGSFFASGLFGQVILIDPADDLVIARFGWSHGDYGGFEELGHHVAAIVAAVRARPGTTGPWLFPR